MKILTCDVLVVGGGLAAASAVKNLLGEDVDVCMAVKGTYGMVGQRGSGASACGASETGTPRLQGMADGEVEQDALYQKMIQAGLGLADRKLAAVMLEDAPEIKRLLREWGIMFGAEGPHHLGYPFIHAIDHEIRASRVKLCENTMITDIVLDDGQCVGAIGVTSTEETVLFKASAVILATGGDAQLFEYNVHPPCVTGDGYAAGFRAGAELMNLEFMQIFFTTVYPTRNLFHVRQKQVFENIYNAEHQRFLADYLPPGISADECLEENLRHAPFSTRDRASRYLGIAIVKEIQAGRGTQHGGVLFDIRSAMDGVRNVQDRFLRARGIDLRAEPVQVTMGHQCSNGGLRIDRTAMTTIPGLFGAGETTTGMHGADRLGGNMLLSCLVFGRRAAHAARDWAKTHSTKGDISQLAQEKLDEIKALASSRGTTSPDELLHTLQRSAWNNALTIRSATRLKAFLADIADIREQFTASITTADPGALVGALELRNLLLVGEMVATAALQRQESRGGHYREDYPDMNAGTPVKAIVLQQAGDGSIQSKAEVIDPDWQSAEEALGSGRWG